MDWIGPRELIGALVATYGSSSSPRRTVCGRAKAGLLRARAVKLLRDGREVEGDLIPTEFWAGGPSSVGGDWGAGDLSSRAPRDSHGMAFVNWEAFGVQFSREDAEKMGADFNALALPPASAAQVDAPTEPSMKRRTGRLPDKEAWQHFCAALAVVAAQDDKGVQIGLSAASIYEKAAQVLEARLEPNATYLSKDSVIDAITLAQEWMALGMPTK